MPTKAVQNNGGSHNMAQPEKHSLYGSSSKAVHENEKMIYCRKNWS